MISVPDRPLVLRALLPILPLLLAGPLTLCAQLRPLEPTDVRAFHDARVRVQFGTAIYWQQYASLTGIKGRLIEVGDVRTSWRSERFLVEISGTIQRLFREDTIIREPVAGVEESTIRRTRRDAGDYRIQTVLRLSGDTSSATATVLRFGTRLPTTDNRVGLERDQTDFFATVAGARAIGDFYITAEAGVGINGTRLSDKEQSDVMIYAATLERPGLKVSPFFSVVGQNDLHRRAIRGNEDLGEIRAGVRVGRHRWLTATILRGFHDSSPELGVQLSAGISFGP